MAPARPMLDDVELQQVQEIEVAEDQVLVQHAVPALEGDFFQGLARRGTAVTLTGVLTGAEVADGLKKLREKFRAATPVPFVADITTATRVEQVLIEEMGVRELAGKPQRFEYAFTLREYIPPPAPEIEPPPPEPRPEPPSVDTGTLIVEVTVEGRPNFDYGRVTVTVEGTQDDGVSLSRTMAGREGNVWKDEAMPPGQYTATAVVTDPEPMSGPASGRVRAGQETTLRITLHPGAVIARMFLVHFWFDKAFIHPCMRAVLRQVAQYAADHPDEKLLIVGHTDFVGDRPPVEPLYNQSLSERRGRSVFAYLTFGHDQAGALAEWDQLRRRRTAHGRRSINDRWGTREYQHMLQDLGYCPGNVDGDHGPRTDAAVRIFQGDKGLTVDGIVGDQTWRALIEAYLSQDALAVPESQFLPNCEGEILKWLGCGEQDPVRNTEDAWRPNRRTELLFVRAERLPCEVAQPDTFELPAPEAVNNAWCLGPGDTNARCCFVTHDGEEQGKWLVQPAEPGEIPVRGQITFEDGTPLANARYVLIAPDGECMDGEQPSGPSRGRTDASGAFDYGSRTKGIGIYTLEIAGPYVARVAGEPLERAKGNVVCKRLDGTSDFDVVVCSLATTFDLQVSGAAQAGGAASTTYVATRTLSDEYVTITAVFPAGTCAAPQSITWLNGEDVPGHPLQRRVNRTTVGQTTVTAALTGSVPTRAVDVFVVRVTLDVDADRDGIVENDATGKNVWEFGAGKKGAVILSNNDNDNKPAGNTEIDNENHVVDGVDDVSDLAPLVVRQSGPLPAGVSLTLSVDDRDKIRIFDQRSSSGTVIIGPGAGFAAQAPITNSTSMDAELGMEATQYPDDGFRGLIQLTLILREGGTEIARDEAKVMVAPWIMPSHLNATEELYVVDASDSSIFEDANGAFVAEIEAIAAALLKKASGATYSTFIPAIGLRRVDRWMQDTVEIGYSRMPGKAVSVALNAHRNRLLRPFARDELLGPDYGYIEASTPTGDNTFDSHGNLEVSPPVELKASPPVRMRDENFQFGRIYYGRGRPTEPFNSEVKKFLIAQRIQKPFEIDTDWLAVGHVDEVVCFVPSNVGGKGFKMLLSDTTEAIDILTRLRTDGHGDLMLFQGKAEARSVNDILSELSQHNPGDLGWANDYCQNRLDNVKATMRSELGVTDADTDADIVKIPALFVENSRSPRLADPLLPPEFDALIPGMVNLLVITGSSVANTHLAIAKPFGPRLLGSDQFERDVLDKLAVLGYVQSHVHFVDDYDTYHLLLGEVHCATNSKRQPDIRPWWEQTDF